MANSNGQLILNALQTLEEPASLQNVVSVVAKTCGTTPKEVQEVVKKTLSGGVKHGFVQYANRKYYAGVEYDDDEDDNDIDNDDDDDVSVSKEKTTKDEQPEDASRRRRRSGSRRRRRSGRRSRSRRRRR